MRWVAAAVMVLSACQLEQSGLAGRQREDGGVDAAPLLDDAGGPDAADAADGAPPVDSAPPDAACRPDCSVAMCGDDGCGGSCGTCMFGACTDGLCVCMRNCGGRICGPDGCGGSCGTCPAGRVCTAAGDSCNCEVSCAGRSCGTDGCGVSCGTCDGDEECVSFSCMPRCGASGRPCCAGFLCDLGLWCRDGTCR